MIMSIHPTGGSDPIGYHVFQNEVYFRASESTLGAELWKTNGTESGTVKITNPSFVITNPLGVTYSFVEINNELLFAARYNYTKNQLWKLGGIVAVEAIDENHEIKLYPNPANDLINIESETSTSITLMNVHGQVLNTYPTNMNHQIDLTNLSQGVYLISINEGQQVHRFVKE